MGQYLKGNNVVLKENHNGGYAHAQICNASNSNLRQNSTKFLREFMGQFFKGQFFGIIKNHNGR